MEAIEQEGGVQKRNFWILVWWLLIVGFINVFWFISLEIRYRRAVSKVEDTHRKALLILNEKFVATDTKIATMYEQITVTQKIVEGHQRLVEQRQRERDEAQAQELRKVQEALRQETERGNP